MESNRAPSQIDELAGRPVRAADYAAENRALVALARVQPGPRSEFLQRIRLWHFAMLVALVSVLSKDLTTIGSFDGSQRLDFAPTCAAKQPLGMSVRAE
jgi:hypothetical protein